MPHSTDALYQIEAVEILPYMKVFLEGIHRKISKWLKRWRAIIRKLYKFTFLKQKTKEVKYLDTLQTRNLLQFLLFSTFLEIFMKWLSRESVLRLGSKPDCIVFELVAFTQILKTQCIALYFLFWIIYFCINFYNTLSIDYGSVV